MIDYSLLYVIFYSTAMSFGAALAFVNSGLKKRFRSLKNKTGHDFGVRILKDIVSGYDGVVNFEDTGDEFEVSLLLPQKETAVTAGG